MTKIDLFNAALLKIGSQAEVTGDNDPSNEYAVCDRCYETALRLVYSIYPWHCCRKYARLNMLNSCEHYRFKYAYQLPLDCINVVSVYPERINFEVSGRKLFTDHEELKIQYTADIENIGELSPLVYQLCVDKLSMMILPSLAKGSYNIKDSMLQEFWNIDFTQAKMAEVKQNFTRPKVQWWIDEE